jgi:hypothetical protein
MFIFSDVPIAIPEGEAGKLSVVMVGRPSRGSVPVVIRNRTANPLAGMEVSGTARNASGTLVGSGSSQGFVPENVKSGEWAFGYVFFGIEPLPADAKFDLTATGKAPSSLFASVDLRVQEVNRASASYGGTKLVGILSNPTNKEVKGPISVDVMCFDGAMPIATVRGFTNADSAAPNGTVPFSVDLPRDSPCRSFAVGGSGHTF